MSSVHNLYCPHCKHLIKSVIHPVSCGSPIKTCSACGERYIDPYCTEPALRQYKALPVRDHLLTGFGGGAVVSLFAALLASIAVKDTCAQWLIFGIGTLVFGSLIFIWLMRSRKEIEKNRLKAWQESDQRLRSPEYATILKLYGYLVPAQYLPPRYWEQKDSFTLQGATVEEPASFQKKVNPAPYMPNGPTDY